MGAAPLTALVQCIRSQIVPYLIARLSGVQMRATAGSNHRDKKTCQALMALISLIAPSSPMASITIRNLEDGLKSKLRVRAARHGRSMEDEARHILRSALAEKTHEPVNLFEAIRRRIAPLGGVDLEISRRGPMREPP